MTAKDARESLQARATNPRRDATRGRHAWDDGMRGLSWGGQPVGA